MKQFQNPCCRCGFCCIVETCPVAQFMYNIDKNYPCPELDYDPETMEATCNLNGKADVGIGTGCCMAARCFKDGIEYDFASLDWMLKRVLAYNHREEKNERHGEKRAA
jgi:hypothetical protein